MIHLALTILAGIFVAICAMMAFAVAVAVLGAVLQILLAPFAAIVGKLPPLPEPSLRGAFKCVLRWWRTPSRVVPMHSGPSVHDDPEA